MQIEYSRNFIKNSFLSQPLTLHYLKNYLFAFSVNNQPKVIPKNAAIFVALTSISGGMLPEFLRATYVSTICPTSLTLSEHTGKKNLNDKITFNFFLIFTYSKLEA